VTRFPVSDHCDGLRFFNPEAAAIRTLGDVVRWQLSSARAPWPRWVDDPPAPPLPAVRPGEIALTFVNHSTFLIRTAGISILTDPVFADRASPFSWLGPRRVRRPGIRLEQLPPIDLVVVSHNHYDHMDLGTLAQLAKRDRPQVITGLGNGRVLAEAGLHWVEELDWWEGCRVGEVEAVMAPAQHFSARGLRDRNRTLWGSFLLRWPAAQVYFAADSGYASHFREIRRRFGPVDLALLPIGAYEPRWFMREAHMNPEEAVMAHRDLAARTSIGMHFGTFRLTDEAIDEPVRRLAEARRAGGVADQEFRVLAFGESMAIPMQETDGHAR
jgi:L-ascorbate metabolism protein UlaG (beta-lactamase superfamily)